MTRWSVRWLFGPLWAITIFFGSMSLCMGTPLLQTVPSVQLGIDRIDSVLPFFAGKRIGLITNATGVNSQYVSSIKVLQRYTDLRALYSPEHGVRGDAQAGDGVNGYTDPYSGLPVYSLYGPTKIPTTDMLEGIDVLTFDIQDVGVRHYTYIYTMAYAMQACARDHKTFVVFDRPNPIGGEAVEGGLIQPGYESFIGMYPIPMRHGLTVGEFAQFINEEFGIHCDLKVVPMTGWKRNMHFSDTGLPWIMTSPNIPTPDSALAYSITGIFGETNISEGVGTTRPFEFVGASWLVAEQLAERLNELQLPGLVFRPAYFTPRFGPHTGEGCGGVQIHMIDHAKVKGFESGLRILQVIQELSGGRFAYRDPVRDGERYSIDLCMGDDGLRTGGYSIDQIIRSGRTEAAGFTVKARKYYLY